MHPTAETGTTAVPGSGKRGRPERSVATGRLLSDDELTGAERTDRDAPLAELASLRDHALSATGRHFPGRPTRLAGFPAWPLPLPRPHRVPLDQRQ